MVRTLLSLIVASAVYGFTLMLLKVINDLKPTCYAIAFDTKAPTFRHQMFDQYKAHRPPTPDELVNQLGRVRELVEAFHIPFFTDLKGTIAIDLDEIIGPNQFPDPLPIAPQG